MVARALVSSYAVTLPGGARAWIEAAPTGPTNLRADAPRPLTVVMRCLIDAQRAAQADPAFFQYPLGGRIAVVCYAADGRDRGLARQILYGGSSRLGGISAAAKSVRHRIHHLAIGSGQTRLDSPAAQSRELAAQELHDGDSPVQVAEGLATRRRPPGIARSPAARTATATLGAGRGAPSNPAGAGSWANSWRACTSSR